MENTIQAPLVLEHISIRPNKIVSYMRNVNRYVSQFRDQANACTLTNEEKNAFGFGRIKRTTDNRHDFELSKSAQTNLQDRITWLYQLSKGKTIKTHNGVIVSNFKMNFVTLTLPSVQKHCSDFITKNCLNQLLIELKEKINLRNYVWRLEYQKNGNLHYHIATDVFIDFYLLRNIWNRILNKYGYVDAYAEKMKGLNINDYLALYVSAEKGNFEEKRKHYAEGVRTGWKKPKSVDVKVCTNSKAVSYYISKYFGKKSSKGSEKKLSVNEENSGNSRLWYCSTSLSKLKSIAHIREAFEFDFLFIAETCKSARTVITDYCKIIYFNLKDLCNDGQRVFNELFHSHARSCGYFDPVPS